MMNIPIDRIAIATDRRPIDAGQVRQLANSIVRIGLLNPITVRKDGDGYTLVAGLHRVEAHRLLGRHDIAAEIFDGDVMAAELAEIDENLFRNELTVLQQSEHLQRRNELLLSLGERAQRGDNRFTLDRSETVSHLQTAGDIGERIGLSGRSVEQRLQIARDITPEAKTVIAGTHLENSTTQLLELARVKPASVQVDVATVAVAFDMTIHSVKNMTPHEYCNIYPMDEWVVRRLVESIGSNGLRVPIWVYDGKILDGKLRFAACRELGIVPAMQVYAGEDPLGLTISMNLRRQHLTVDQRAFVVLSIRERI